MNDHMSEPEQWGVKISITGGSSDQTQRMIQERMNATYEAMHHHKLVGLYEGREPSPPRPLWKILLRRYCDRVRDAWLVLIGHASIGDY